MRLLDRYIAVTVLKGLAGAVLCLAGLDTLFAFLAEMEDLTPSYQMVDAAIYTLATFPRRLYENIPVGTLIGCLVSLGMMSHNSELVVVRAAGISIYRIIYGALKAVAILVILSLVLGEFILPYAEKYGQSYRALKQGGGSMLRVKQGNWHRDGEDFIHISAIEPNGVVHDVTRYRVSDDNQLTRISYTPRAKYFDGAWYMEEDLVLRYGADEVTLRRYKKKQWDTGLTPKLVELVVLKPEHLSITGLYEYSQHMRDEGLSYRPYLLAFWKKVLQPFAIIVMIGLAVSFIFGSMRSVAIGTRVMVGMVLGLGFTYTQDLFGYASLVFDIQPFFAAAIPVVIFGVAAMTLLLRAK